MNKAYRKPLPGTSLDYYDAREAVETLQAGAWAALSYTARVHAENIVRKADPAIIDACLLQLIERKRELDFPWYPARVVCHDILGQTALVDRPRWWTSPACATRSPTRAATRRR